MQNKRGESFCVGYLKT